MQRPSINVLLRLEQTLSATAVLPPGGRPPIRQIDRWDANCPPASPSGHCPWRSSILKSATDRRPRFQVPWSRPTEGDGTLFRASATSLPETRLEISQRHI